MFKIILEKGEESILTNRAGWDYSSMVRVHKRCPRFNLYDYNKPINTQMSLEAVSKRKYDTTRQPKRGRLESALHCKCGGGDGDGCLAGVVLLLMVELVAVTLLVLLMKDMVETVDVVMIIVIAVIGDNSGGDGGVAYGVGGAGVGMMEVTMVRLVLVVCRWWLWW